MGRTRKLINISPETYERLSKQKWEHQKEIGQTRYSFDQFLNFLMDLYESELESVNKTPSIYNVQESS